MKHAENTYIQAGYKYEKSPQLLDDFRILLQLVMNEPKENRPEASRLIAQGRAEARR